MTGSLLLNRQHSSTAGYSSMNKTTRPKLRRCSSADDHNSFEITPDENQRKRDSTTPSDIDSGIEDFDQQVANLISSQPNNVDDEETVSNFGPCENDDDEEPSTPIFTEIYEDPEQQFLQRLCNDLTLAAKVPDHTKKDFCLDTREVFHAEFARHLSWPIAMAYPGIRYHLHAEEEVDGDACEWRGFSYVKLDNAKAQFKCPNLCCGRLWTSMRARISFKISQPQDYAFVVLKIYGQNCKQCETPADALWYIEEVCRVMRNLTESIFGTFFPSMIVQQQLQGEEENNNGQIVSRRSRHDPHQRKGKMRAPHDSNLCEACQHGWCFA